MWDMGHVIFVLNIQVFIKINNVYGNLKDQLICVYVKPEAIPTVQWKPHLWGWPSITTNINYAIT